MIRITSENMKGEGLNGHLVVKSIDEIDFPDNSFDLVTIWSVLEHVTDPEKFQKGCRNIVRVTRPGGQILLSEWAPQKSSEYRTHKHIVGRAYHEYRETLEREGAFLIKERGIHLFIHLHQAYGTIAAELASILKKRSKCVDESLDSEEFMQATNPKLVRLFYLGRRALITLSKPVELYLVPLRPFSGLSDRKLMLLQKKSL